MSIHNDLNFPAFPFLFQISAVMQIGSVIRFQGARLFIRLPRFVPFLHLIVAATQPDPWNIAVAIQIDKSAPVER